MWLSKDEFEKLTGKASKHDAFIASILKVNEGMKAEDATPEFIEEALTASDNVKVDETLSAKVTELEGRIATMTTTSEQLTGERDTLKSENEGLQSKVDALSKLPGAESITTVKPEAESSTIETDDLLAFATEHAGDTIAIAEKMRAAGYGAK